MQNMTFGRRPYWIFVAALIVLKFGVVITIMVAPQALDILRHVDTAIIVVLALVAGGRFADIGWPRWLGAILVFVIAFVVPIALVLASPPTLPVDASNPLDALPNLAWVGTVMLMILLIVAGIKTSASASGLDQGIGGKPAERGERKEPTFP